MTIDVYTTTGTKKGTLALPEGLFGARINQDLMHQAVIMQQSNRRAAIAHVKTRGEVRGSTKKLFSQKGTGRARRGPIRSPLLRGGGKAFGPRSNRNFTKDMPKAMRHAALRSCLSLRAKNKVIFGLETYPETIKTKTLHQLLKKLPVEAGRRLLFVVSEKHDALAKSARNLRRVKVISASYLNPEDVLLARSIVFVGDAIEKASTIFGATDEKNKGDKRNEMAPSLPSRSSHSS